MLLGSTIKYRIMNAGGQMKTIIIGYLPININQSVEYSHGETPLELTNRGLSTSLLAYMGKSCDTAKMLEKLYGKSERWN